MRTHLVRHSDIERGITNHILWSFRDISLAQNSLKLVGMILLMCMTLSTITFMRFNTTQNRLLFGVRKSTPASIKRARHDLLVFFQHTDIIIFKSHE